MSVSAQINVKRLLFLVLLLIFLLPAGQAKFKLIQFEELGGYSGEAAPHPELNWAALANNSYQTGLEHYLEARLGFRELLIRARNQLAYTVFEVAHANQVLVGRDQVLYEERPIRAYLGEDFVGDATVARHVRRFRAVQDTLARRGKLLVFVAAASKASFMPEFLPAYHQNQPLRRSNYQAYAAAMRAAGVNFLDVSHAFRQWKDTASYPLFPRGGIHWSCYAAKLVGDTLLHYLARQYHHPFRDFRLIPGDVTREPRDTDNDIAKAMNLLTPPPAYSMAYPNVEFQALKPGQQRPNLLLIGDSFCWTIMYPFINEAFDNTTSRFWYYNNDVSWPENPPEGRAVSALNHKQQYLSRDIIVVMFTEYNMNQLDGGFSDDAFNLFTPYTRTDSLRIKEFENALRKTPGLAEKWWKRCADSGQSLDQLIRGQAVAQYDSIR